MKHCIHEPDDACGDCSPNCPNSATFGQPEPKLVEVCPQCGASTVQANLGNGKTDVYCEECGWPDEDFGTPDCRCFNCATAAHNGGDDDCACDEAGPWFDADRCGSCKHGQVCDVARNPDNYPAPMESAE